MSNGTREVLDSLTWTVIVVAGDSHGVFPSAGSRHKIHVAVLACPCPGGGASAAAHRASGLQPVSPHCNTLLNVNSFDS